MLRKNNLLRIGRRIVKLIGWTVTFQLPRRLSEVMHRRAAQAHLRLRPEALASIVMFPSVNLTSLEAYQQFRMSYADESAACRAAELNIALAGPEALEIPGFCCVCGRATYFRAHRPQITEPISDCHSLPNWREEMTCAHCNLSNRFRASLHLFYQEICPEAGAHIYITERNSPLYHMLSSLHPNLVGSEYLGSEHSAGEIIDGIQHEDIHNLSFPDRSLDIILSFDVLEHIADLKQGLCEIFRCLRPGGAFLFSVPFRDSVYMNEVRACLDNAKNILYLMPAQYHVKPVDLEGGALVYQIPGWHMLDQLRDIGFEAVAARYYWSRDYGYLGESQFLFTARKPMDANPTFER